MMLMSLMMCSPLVAVAEIPILGHHDASVGVGELRDLTVGRSVPIGQSDRVHRVVAGSVHEVREAGRKLRVDEELHAAVALWPGSEWRFRPTSAVDLAQGDRGEAPC